MRRKVRLTGLASAVSTLLAPEFVVGLPAFTRASAMTVATGAAGGQTGGGPPTQVPPAQVSAVVQSSLSSHGGLFAVFMQPVAGSHESVVHTLPSTQLGGGPPTQTPPAQVSAVVQALPSLQGSVFGVPPTHAAAPSQVLPLMQGLLAQAWPAGSNWQVGEQQSPATRLPSSHCSPRSTTPLPQTWAILPMRTVNWLVCTPPAGKPGPWTPKTFWPQGLPVTVWGAAGLPTKPA